jgi:DNA-binding response OmpR family regulator
MNPLQPALRIAIVEDDEILREELSYFLRGHGHIVTELVTGKSLDDLMFKTPLDLLILDLNLPGENGFDIALRVKSLLPNIRILMLTARTALSDRIQSYNSGADIYLPKPTSPLEILAAVNSLGRRLATSTGVKEWTLHMTRSMLTSSENNNRISLSSIELALLIALTHAPGSTADTESLCATLTAKNNKQILTKRALENLVSRLRKKITDTMNDEHTPTIRSVRNVGYQLCLPVSILE